MSKEAQHRVTVETGWTRELLFQLVDSVREYAIFASDLDGMIVGWNVGAELTFGYSAAEAVGMDSRLLFTPDDRALGIPDAEMQIAREKGHSEDERWHIRKDGSLFFASGIQTAVFNEKNELTGYAKIARDLTERLRFEEQLAAAEESLETRVDARTKELTDINTALNREVKNRRRSEEIRVALLRKIVSTQEGERKRIAREIHDNIGQQMTALKLKLVHLLSIPISDPKLREHIVEMEALTNQVDSEVDFLAWELRPAVLDDLGLSAAINTFVSEWSQHFGISAEYRSTGLGRHLLLPEIEINLYRIAQEALNNIYKHASAKKANVLLELRDHTVVLIIEDDGIGFSPEKKRGDGDDRGLGILGMQERAELVGGNLEIESAIGLGTTVFARIPAQFADGFGSADPDDD